ncbi:MAG: NAD(P)-binding protein [Xanthomonadales bacterium]
MAKVIIMGGGVGGMTAAHELITRGYEVEVYDLGDLPGGKAKSMYHGSAVGPNGRLPAEHGFRFFPGWYKHIDDTMKRTPYAFDEAVDNVFDNLTEVDEVGFASFDHPPLLMRSRFPKTVQQMIEMIRQMFDHPTIHFEPGEVEFFGARLWQILTSSHRRRLAVYEKVGWWEFIEAENKSEDYKKYLANLPRTLVAADPHTVSTKTNGDVFLQMLLDMGPGSSSVDRVLMGPTNEMWLFAWLKYLLKEGVRYYINAEVTEILADGKGVSGATVVRTRDPIVDTSDPDNEYRMARITDIGRYGILASEDVPGQRVDARGDHYIAAMPVEAFAPLAGKPNTSKELGKSNATGLMRLDPSLESITALAESVDWMSGCLFYLKSGSPSLKGHTVYVDPDTALTSIFQKQYWKGIDMSQYGDGQTADILSMDISDWTKGKGRRGTTLDRYPSRKDVEEDTWANVLDSFAHAPAPFPLNPENRHDCFLDPAIQMLDDPAPDEPTMTNRTPLLVNKVNTWSLRPEAFTRIRNFYIASDYVRTYTDLATMEGANEAARRAVNALLERDGSKKKLCKLWQLHEPDILAIARWWDGRRFDKSLPYKEYLPWPLRIVNRVYQGVRRLF